MKKVTHTYNNGFKPNKVVLKDNYIFYPKSLTYKIFNFITILISNILILIPKLIIGYKVIGKKNLKKVKNAVFISNHAHVLDAFLIGTTLFPKKIYCTTLQSNMGFPIISKYLRLCGAVPIPMLLNHKKRFYIESINTLKNNSILFYPEASLIPFSNRIREFDTGAFNIAYKSNSLIVPIMLTFHKPNGIYKFIRRKPLVHLNILKPYKVTDKILAKDELYEIMNSYFLENSDFFFNTNCSNS
jgi:1-acyl-sn-glycerol-3-phosphate acyltransferase